MINSIKIIKYFLQFVVISFLLLVFKALGLKISRFISGKIFTLIGPLFRSDIITNTNISQAFPREDEEFKKRTNYDMWLTYGKILAEYNFIKNFREQKLEKK